MKASDGTRSAPMYTIQHAPVRLTPTILVQPWFDGRLGAWGGSAFGHTACYYLSEEGGLSVTAPSGQEAPAGFL